MGKAARRMEEVTVNEPKLEYSFGQWLKIQTKRADPVGDIARDYIAPDANGKKCCSRFQRFDTILRHIRSKHNPFDAAENAMSIAYSEYRTVVRFI